MSHPEENVILEELKRFQASIDRQGQRFQELTGRIGQLEQSIAAVRLDFAVSEGRLAAMSVRLDRMADRQEPIERRLELVG